MMVIGVDPHKGSHTAAAVDGLGRKTGCKSVPATREGHRELIAWARAQAPQGRRWAVEDVRHVASGLVRELLAAGEEVVFVPTRLMAESRKGGRERGKSDPIDALANARAALREEEFLPPARLPAAVLEVRRLADHRDDLVAGRTRAVNRLRWLVHDLDPALAPPPRALTRTASAPRELHAALLALPASAGRRVALSLLAAVTAATAEVTQLEADLTTLLSELCPQLLAVCGIGVVTAARLLGEAGDIRRFRSPAAYARHNGTAPIPASSGTPSGGPQRLNRGGNRKANAAIHRTALTQTRHHPGARALLERRATIRETRKAALRVLKRHLSDVIYRALRADAWRLDQPLQTAA